MKELANVPSIYSQLLYKNLYSNIRIIKCSLFYAQKTLWLFLVASLIISCSGNKDYKYVEIVEEEGIMGVKETREKDTKTIKALNDSIAYLEAYKKFCISLKVNADMKESLGRASSTLKEFKLYNEKGEDIANTIFFVDKEKLEKQISDQIFSMANNIQHSIDQNKKDKEEAFKNSNTIDSAKIKELEKFFSKKKDEFSNDKMIWYKPKSAPAYTNRNGLYCYFQTDNGIPSNLRFRLQYYSDDWLFFKKVQFLIDGTAYDYIPLKTETDSGDGGYIWEWFDDALSESDKGFIYALSKAKTAKMKLIGRQYYDIKAITKDQILSIQRTLELYKALGGHY